MPLALLKNTNDAVKHLLLGHLVIYPTETAYALGADATNQKAVRKIFQVKRRAKNKTLPIIVASIKMANNYGNLSASIKKIVMKYWPGPLTVVVPVKKNLLPHLVRGKDDAIALRVSSHRLARLLSKGLKRPIISTSANVSGQNNSYSLQTIKKVFSFTPETIYLLSGGTLRRRPPSTIITIKNGKLIVLRQGNLKVEKRSKIINRELRTQNL